jgi:hypothetical protein
MRGLEKITVCRPPEGDEHFLDSQWGYLLGAFGVAETARAAIDSTTPVVVFQPRAARKVAGETSLHDFVHPASPAIYLFGGSHSVMSQADLAELNVVAKVYIPLNDDWELFSSQACGIALWDRVIKNG